MEQRKRILKLEDVFNEAKFPDCIFIPIREYRFIKSAIRAEGKHLTIAGPSGCGKTTIIKKGLEEENISDENLLWLNAREFDKAKSFNELFAMALKEDSISFEGIVYLLESVKFTIIDDFHFLSQEVKFEIAKNLKLLHEKHIRFIIIGIASSVQELVGNDTELGIRNEPFEIKMQNDEFCNALINKGEELLNFHFAEHSKANIIKTSSGTPSIIHIICRYSLLLNGIEKTQVNNREIKVNFDDLKKEVVRIFDAKYFAKIHAIAKGKQQSILNTYFDIIETIAKDNRFEIPTEYFVEKLVNSIADEKERKRKQISLQSCLTNLADVIKNNNASELIFYDKSGKVISIEDPSLRFYLNLFDINKLKSILKIRNTSFTYDVAISFAGENRDKAEEFKLICESKGLSVFYDFDQKAQLWGQDLNDVLTETYRYESQFMVILVSEHYREKDWTNFEFVNGKDAEKERSLEYLLPIRLDDTHIVGLKETIAFMDYRKQTIEQIVDILAKKINNV